MKFENNTHSIATKKQDYLKL